MCGIWTYLLKNGSLRKDILYKSFEMLQYRGPDRSNLTTLSDKNIMLGFHRLSIMDTSTNGDQPFIIEDNNRVIYTLCNGEIYNFKELLHKYNFKTTSNSDCEIIPLIYKNYGINQLVKDIRGEFAIIILDINKITNEMTCHVVRDPFGVRPLFIGVDDRGICISSELKGQSNIYDVIPDNYIVDQFKGGNYGTFKYIEGQWSDIQLTQYYFFPKEIKYFDQNESIQLIRNKFIEAVKCRLQSDRPLGFLLSGGIDSSSVVGVAYSLLKDTKPLYTFSIGFEGGTDEPNAKLVAKYINSDIITVPYNISIEDYQRVSNQHGSNKGLHTHIMITNEQAINMIESTVRIIESFDLTSVRASVMQLMISKFISKYTNIKVLLCGDASDEQYGSYLYFSKCNDPKEFNDECIRLMDEIYKYDGLRCDRCVSNSEIEIRLPFSDQSLVDLTFSIDPKLRMTSTHKIEKWLFRESMMGFIPEIVRNRIKTAMSDGVSSKEKSWYQIIQDRLESNYTKEDLEIAKSRYQHLTPYTKEGLYYRELFCRYYGSSYEVSTVIPYYWLPKWTGIDPKLLDPSARTLVDVNTGE
jgi:asparagine synthase (glutamine-hydrolysing)